jgi:hypothetical protein
MQAQAAREPRMQLGGSVPGARQGAWATRLTLEHVAGDVGGGVKGQATSDNRADYQPHAGARPLPTIRLSHTGFSRSPKQPTQKDLRI